MERYEMSALRIFSVFAAITGVLLFVPAVYFYAYSSITPFWVPYVVVLSIVVLSVAVVFLSVSFEDLPKRYVLPE